MESKVFIGDNEREVITKFHKFLSRFKNPILAGFNITGFDIPIIKSRFIKYDLPKLDIFGNKYDCLDCRDTLESLTAKGTLQNYLDFFEMEGKYNGYNGASVQGLYEEGKWDEIEKYQLQDSIIEHRLLDKILRYSKTKYNMDKVITFDIEVIIDPKKVVMDYKLPTEEESYLEYEKVLKGKYKQDKTIAKYLSEFKYKDVVAKYDLDFDKEKSKLIFDKFSNQVISVGVSWGSIEEVEVGF